MSLFHHCFRSPKITDSDFLHFFLHLYLKAVHLLKEKKTDTYKKKKTDAYIFNVKLIIKGNLYKALYSNKKSSIAIFYTVLAFTSNKRNKFKPEHYWNTKLNEKSLPACIPKGTTFQVYKTWKSIVQVQFILQLFIIQNQLFGVQESLKQNAI